MRYIPAGSKLIVYPIEDDREQIIVTEKSPTTPIKGEVREIGPGEWQYTENIRREPMEYRPTSIVYFFPQAARKVTLDGQEFYVIDQGDILFSEED